MPVDSSETLRLQAESPYAREQEFLGIMGDLPAGNDNITEQLRTILRQLGLESINYRMPMVQEGILQRQRQASGSPQEILTVFNQQINQIQQQLAQQMETINRQGGYAMGGQRKRAQGQVTGAALGQYQGLIGQGVLEGQRNLLGLTTGVTPTTATGVPQASRSVTTQPVDLSGAGASLADLQGLLQRIFAPQGQLPTIQNNPTIQQPPLLSPQPALTMQPMSFNPYATMPLNQNPPVAGMYGPAAGGY